MNWTSAEKIVLPIAAIIIVIITVVLSILLKNKSQKTKQIPFIVIAVFLLAMEVVKQYLSFPNYPLWNIPLHYCSTFLFWFPMASFFRKKISDVGFTLSVIFGLLFMCLFYINPSSIIGNSASNILGGFFSFHTFIYHHLIILFVLLSITLGKFKPKLNQVKSVVLVYTIYAIISVAMANLLQVNFTNLIESNIGFMQAILNNHGLIIYTIIMYAFGLLALLFWFFAGVFLHGKKKDLRNLKLIVKRK